MPPIASQARALNRKPVRGLDANRNNATSAGVESTSTLKSESEATATIFRRGSASASQLRAASSVSGKAWLSGAAPLLILRCYCLAIRDGGGLQTAAGAVVAKRL